jgi:hypothetical protein
MQDLREYRFDDWLSIFLKAVPALLVANLAIALPLAAAVAVFWFLLPL